MQNRGTCCLKKCFNTERSKGNFVRGRVDAKTFGWASMIPLSPLSFVQCGQVKSRPEKRVEIISIFHVNENALNSEDSLKYNKVRPSNYLFQLFLTL